MKRTKKPTEEANDQKNKHTERTGSPVSAQRFAIRDGYALAFGLFLGLAILKFGNPIILNDNIAPPGSFREALFIFWPPAWGVWLLAPLTVIGTLLAFSSRTRWPGRTWLWLLPLVWVGWQLISATTTVDAHLTTLTILHLAGSLACYYLGALVLGSPRCYRWLLVGVLAAFTYCLVRAVDQRLFEFPQERQMLVEGQQSGWTNFPYDVFLQLKREGVIISTNGMDVANPTIVAKYSKARVNGTMVYPNALAALVLLLFPMAITLVFQFGYQLKTSIRLMLQGLTLFLGLGSFFWTGSKSGWLIATMLMAATLIFYVRWSPRAKLGVVISLVAICLCAFAVRFRGYFATGATSLGARFDYWRAAAQVIQDNPLLGSGPGTFQRPYAFLKLPEAEMARLVHNDYLEQFSDSGITGGIAYAAWIGSLLAVLWKRVRASRMPVHFATLIGLLGWFTQGFTEFSLYVPASAWTAFAIAGSMLAQTANRFDIPNKVP